MRVLLHAVAVICVLACASPAFAQAGPQQFQFPGSILNGGGGAGGGGISEFAHFYQTITGSGTLADSSTSLVTTVEVTQKISATQTLPTCQANGKFYVIWESNDTRGGWTPTFAPPAGWTLIWPEGGETPCVSGVCGTPPTPNTSANLTDIYSFQCDLVDQIIFSEGFVPANASTAGNPAGVTPQLQFNNGGSFGAVPTEAGSGACGILGYLSGVWQWYWDNIYNVKCLCGAKGDGTTDDTAAIQSCINSAEAATLNNPVSGPIVRLPWSRYKVGGVYPNYQPITLQGPSLGGTSPGITIQGDGPQVTGLVNEGTVPDIFVEPIGYATTVLGTGADAWTSAPLVGAVGASLNWGTGLTSQRYLNLKDLNQANGANAIGEEAGLINGISSFDARWFFQFPSGLTNGQTYVMADAAARDGITTTSVLNIHLLAGSTNALGATINMSDGSHGLGAALAGLTPNVPHVLEFNVDGTSNAQCTAAATPASCCTGSGAGNCTGSGTNTVNFFLDGTKVSASSSVTPGATIVSPPSVQFLIGDSNLGIWSDNTGGSNSQHWVGQMYSLQIGKTAYNTSNYTPPTAAFTSDVVNQWLLLNADHINDVWITTDGLIGGSGALAFHAENLAGGNIGATIKGIGTINGSYGVFAIGPLYMRLLDDKLSGTESGIHIENNSYGGVWANIFASTSSFGESAFELFKNSGHINVAGTLNMSIGAYGGIAADSNLTIGEAFAQGANPYNVAFFSLYGDTPFDKYTLTDASFDNEGGSMLTCFQVSGTGSVSVIDSDCQTISTNYPIAWNPSNTGGSLQVIGSSFETNGGSPTAITHNVGSNIPATPGIFIGDTVNNLNLDTTPIPVCTDMTKCSRYDSSFVPPSSTVANLPVCTNCIKGILREITDCNANCSSYQGTTFTGGGSLHEPVMWNGTAWELH